MYLSTMVSGYILIPMINAVSSTIYNPMSLNKHELQKLSVSVLRVDALYHAHSNYVYTLLCAYSCAGL